MAGPAARIAAFSPGSNAWRRSAASAAFVSPINSTIQVQLHAPANGKRTSNRLYKLGLEGMVSKKINVPYRSGPSKSWIKVKNPKAPAAMRAIDETF
jgi:ATP-dependent DNA ligase